MEYKFSVGQRVKIIKYGAQVDGNPIGEIGIIKEVGVKYYQVQLLKAPNDDARWPCDDDEMEPYVEPIKSMEANSYIDMRGAYEYFMEQRKFDTQKYLSKLYKDMIDALGIDPSKPGSDRTVIEVKARDIGHGMCHVTIPPVKPNTRVIIKHDDDVLSDILMDEGNERAKSYYTRKELINDLDGEQSSGFVKPSKTLQEIGKAQPECHLPPMPAYEPPPEPRYQCPYCYRRGTKAAIKEHLRITHKETVALGSPVWGDWEVKK